MGERQKKSRASTLQILPFLRARLWGASHTPQPPPSLTPAPQDPLVSRQRHKGKVERRAWEAQAELAVTQSTRYLAAGGGGDGCREGDIVKREKRGKG